MTYEYTSTNYYTGIYWGPVPMIFWPYLEAHQVTGEIDGAYVPRARPRGFANIKGCQWRPVTASDDLKSLSSDSNG